MVYKQAKRTIDKRMAKAADYYNRKHNSVLYIYNEGDYVQYANLKNKDRAGGKWDPSWLPADDYVVIRSINRVKLSCILEDRNGKLLSKKSFSLVNLRIWYDYAINTSELKRDDVSDGSMNDGGDGLLDKIAPKKKVARKMSKLRRSKRKTVKVDYKLLNSVGV